MTSRAIQTFIVMLTQITTIASTDMLLPSLPSLTFYFGASDDAVQLAIPLFLMGAFLFSPIFGIFSDYFGRKPIMLWGISLFIFGSLLCIYSSTLVSFLVGRFMQGGGAVASTVVGWAIIQDLYHGEESAKMISWVGSVVSLAPILAPGLGGYIHSIWGWQGSFIFVLLLSLSSFLMFFFLKTTLIPKIKGKEISFFNTFKTYKSIVGDLPFLFYISLYSLLSCGEWCYLTTIPFYFENRLFLSPSTFGLYLSASAIFIILGTLITPSILKRLGFNKTLMLGIGVALCGSCALFSLAIFASGNVFFIIVFFGLYLLGKAIIWGPTTSRALQRFDERRGAASAVRGLLLMLSFALGGFVGSYLDDASLVPTTLFLMAITFLCWMIQLKKFDHNPIAV